MKSWVSCAAAAALAVIVAAGCTPKAKVTIPSTGRGGIFGDEGVGPGGFPLSESPEGPFAEPENYSDPAAKEIFVDVHFDYNQSDIRASERPIVEGIAGYMREHPTLTIKVEGHCDERGSNEYNMSLGENRALAVRSHLASLGIAADRIQTRSYGEEKPAVAGSGEEAWHLNRRGEFALFQK